MPTYVRKRAKKHAKLFPSAVLPSNTQGVGGGAEDGGTTMDGSHGGLIAGSQGAVEGNPPTASVEIGPEAGPPSGSGTESGYGGASRGNTQGAHARMGLPPGRDLPFGLVPLGGGPQAGYGEAPGDKPVGACTEMVLLLGGGHLVGGPVRGPGAACEGTSGGNPRDAHAETRLPPGVYSPARSMLDPLDAGSQGMHLFHATSPKHTQAAKGPLLRFATCGLHTPLVHVTHDGREGHFLFPNPTDNQYHTSRQKFGFVGVRWMAFANGHQWVSWCSHCPCGTEHDVNTGDLLEGRDYPHLQPTQVLKQTQLCEAALALLQCKDVGKGLLSYLQEARDLSKVEVHQSVQKWSECPEMVRVLSHWMQIIILSCHHC